MFIEHTWPVPCPCLAHQQFHNFFLWTYDLWQCCHDDFHSLFGMFVTWCSVVFCIILNIHLCNDDLARLQVPGPGPRLDSTMTMTMTTMTMSYNANVFIIKGFNTTPYRLNLWHLCPLCRPPSRILSLKKAPKWICLITIETEGSFASSLTRFVAFCQVGQVTKYQVHACCCFHFRTNDKWTNDKWRSNLT